MDILKKFLNNPAFDHISANIIRFMDARKVMDILKNLLMNPAFDRLVENIISSMDTDEVMESMIEYKHFSEEERRVFRKVLRKLMVKEAQKICEKKVTFESRSDGLVNPSLFEMYPFFKDVLQKLKNSESLESFNQLYDILVWLQPGESQSADEVQLQHLYNMSDLYKKRQNFNFKDHKGPEDMLEVFELANEDNGDEVLEKLCDADARLCSLLKSFEKIHT